MAIEDKYQKKTQREHILLRPDTYVGSIQINKEKLWILNEEGDKFDFKEIDYIAGLFKIFDEILVNAADNSQNDDSMTSIKCNIEKDLISIENDGKGIPIIIHEKENCYIPELIFGHFLTGSNFDDTKKRTTGGRNGFGAKLTNVYSKEFKVEIYDIENNKYFTQIYKDNMTYKSEPSIKSKKLSKGKVKISFIPDYDKFKISEISDDMLNLLKKRVYDIAATTNKNIKVYLNDLLIKENNLEKYVKLYYDNENSIHEKINENWELCILFSPDHMFEQISIVNSINTYNGGTHIKYITDMIVKKLEEIVKKKHKDLKTKPQMFKDHMIIFLNCLIDKPQFSSQTKEELTSKPNTFGSTCEINNKIIKKLVSFGIIDQVINFIKIKEEMTIKKKNDGKKVNNIKGIPKLEDANLAGGKQSDKCILILTEGDSAKALAMAGRTVVGNDYYGVFPLKGKLLNVREATAKQQIENEEIKHINKIVGLQIGKKYTDTKSLRYGKILMFSDQDDDGFHIKGLFMNYIHYYWPELLKLDFLISLATPIIRASKRKSKKDFYNLPEFYKWSEKLKNINEWQIKYYKGLGTSNSSEAKEYFTDIDKKIINYKCDTEEEDSINISDKFIKLAFEKIQANNRKTWLLNKEDDMSISADQKIVTYSEFINKELKLFSYSDIERSIPSIMDGLKPSTRKILHSCFIRNLRNKKNEIKVTQLAGFVSDKTNYHHGEKSLTDAIITMAQNFTGSNNINLLAPSGQFGSRLLGGKDHASPRYIFTYLENITQYIFRSEDECILNYLSEEGSSIQPEYFLPIIPMVLVNGCEGIGTGFSTFIPKYNPKVIINNIINILNNKELKPLVPWYRNFNGKIVKQNNDVTIYGKYNVIDDNNICIEELPIGVWTTPYKNYLESIEINSNTKGKDIINNFRDNNTENDINFIINFPNKKLELYIGKDTLDNKFKLIKTMKLNNMHLFDKKGNIKKFNSAEDILKEWVPNRLEYYEIRKEFKINQLKNELEFLKNKVNFIDNIIEEKIILKNNKKSDIISKLEELKFTKLNIDIKKEKNYDYLINMSMISLSIEKKLELKEKLNEKEKELKNLLDTSTINIWKTELKILLKNL